MRYSKKEMKIRVDYNNMMASVLGRAARRRSSCRTMPTRNRISS